MERCNTLSLSGQWELCWQETGTLTPEQAQVRLDSQAIPCPVPGDVHMALAAAGIIPEPLKDIHNEDCKWMEQQEFWYRKKFYVEPQFVRDRMELVLEGLDLTADIYLNGHYIGSHNNAFIEKMIDISEVLRPGENALVIRIDDGINAVKDKPLDFARFSWNNDQPYRIWMRKPQYVYGWDWTIWMPTCGIWKDVYIRSSHLAAIADVWVRTDFDGECIADAPNVRLKLCADVSFLRPGSYRLNWKVSGDARFGGGTVAEEWTSIAIGEGHNGSYSTEVTLEDPHLWWPNGSGDPYLYGILVTIEDETGNILDCRSLRHGLRTVEIREDRLDERSKSFTFAINGRRIFCKGANHVPADCLLGRITEAKTRQLLRMAADAHMNMIRVWGGGVYESDCFMDECDELGLMVWHDFMFACGFYPDHDPEFYEEIRREATAAILRLRSHPSLVGWSGNNEIQEMYQSVKRWHPEQQWNGGRLYEQLLPELVSRHCPDRIYRQSSPFGGDTADSYDEGDQHTWHFTHRPGWDHYLDLWRFTDFDFKFLSEFGIIGAMNLESAKKCIRPDALRPDSAEWRHHTNTSQEHGLLDIFVDTYFGSHEGLSVQEYILKSQVIQAEIMRHIYDELRSRKFRCSGILLWTLSDSYGIHNWSLIDYYLGKRPVYYYLKRSMAPVNVCFLGYEVQNFDGMAGYRDYYQGDVQPIAIHLANDALEEKQVSVEYRMVTFGGKVLMRKNCTHTIPANRAQKIGEVDISGVKDTFVPEETVLYARVWEDGQVVNENHYFFAPFGKLRLQPATVEWKLHREDGKTRLALTADTFVWMLHLEDAEGVEYTDNDCVLLPGVPKVIELQGDVPAEYCPVMHSLNPYKH